ncbi:hypothetical protein EAH_00068130 [Eimeria acervulina]|uniref:Secreted protein n=1 Tax=Eimeria acervulina TaxID=5801 RepID=U6GUS3_EIMAC|nr:hypothetical protein EAH_00068130 [Eimeria acervulina]CDI83013.1 hypothetical protein EAH_00068130 [Eimeria acervulina]
MRRICVLSTALDLASAALCIGGGWCGQQGQLMLEEGCVAFTVFCHAVGEDKYKMRRICLLKTVMDLAAGALCVEMGDGGKLNGANIV